MATFLARTSVSLIRLALFALAVLLRLALLRCGLRLLAALAWVGGRLLPLALVLLLVGALVLLVGR